MLKDGKLHPIRPRSTSRRSRSPEGALATVEAWHEVIGEPTFADAILDRLVHNSYRLALKGESMRKQKPIAAPKAAARGKTR